MPVGYTVVPPLHFHGVGLSTTAFAVVFLLAMAVFAVTIAWVSIRSATHTPEALQTDDARGSEASE